jgi:mannose/cellobiose epimerase-like protein (N-acyl-D-glucosamine 2-epimerase family)
MAARLKPAAAALLGWATDAALPLWATAGFDVEHGRFEERLSLGAERLPDVPIRLLSQARQIYAYALAARRGWYPGAATLVERAYASMVRDFLGRDGRHGWIPRALLAASSSLDTTTNGSGCSGASDKSTGGRCSLMSMRCTILPIDMDLMAQD